MTCAALEKGKDNGKNKSARRKFITTEHLIADLHFRELAACMDNRVGKKVRGGRGGKCPQYRESARFLEQDIISNFLSQLQNTENWTTLCVRVEDSPRAHYKAASPRNPKFDSSGFSCRTSKTASYVCQCTTTQTGLLRIMQLFAANSSEGSEYARSFALGSGLSSDLETKKMVRNARLQTRRSTKKVLRSFLVSSEYDYCSVFPKLE